MSPLEMTTAINTLANIIACSLSDQELALASAAFSQLGDTLSTIAVLRENCKSTAAPTGPSAPTGPTGPSAPTGPSGASASTARAPIDEPVR